MTRLFLLAAAALTAATASPASAQSFLERAARAAAERAATNIVTGAVDRAARPSEAAPEVAVAPAAAVSPGGERATASTVFADPAPINYSARLRGPYQLEFSPELENAEAAFDEFNRVSCSDCEGGRSYDSWIKQAVPEVSRMGALEQRIGEMPVGDAIRWTGTSGARLALTVIGEAPVGAWPCKQVRWSSERDGRSAERLGLFCNGKRGDYLGDGWVEVL
jgi:hypothetical protein